MDILWTAAGICVIVCFVFYVLALHWQRVLRHQSWMVRRLGDRLQVLEEIGDPQFRRRLSESAPMPLEQVFTFTFRLSEQFWRHTLSLTDKNWDFIRAFGSFVGSVKLECWRSHAVATITEVLPESKTAQWRSRSLDFYPDSAKAGDNLMLWELRLAQQNGSAERPPSLELLLRGNAIELCGHLTRMSHNGHGEAPDAEVTFFRVPLDCGQLAEFRSQDPTEDSHDPEGGPGSNGSRLDASSWRAFYSSTDETIGYEWQLWLRDLTRKAEWDRWKILEPAHAQSIRD